MTRVMLDTNVVSALLKDPRGGVAERIGALAAPASVSIIVAAELRYGAAKKGSDRLAASVERVLEALEIEPLSAPVDRVYATLREFGERAGAPLGANDLLIAAHALALGRRLVTRDRAFSRVPGLAGEGWPG